MSDICPECSADVSQYDARCSTCGEELPGDRLKTPPSPKIERYDPNLKEFAQFGLRELLIATAIVACLFGLFRLAPFLGVLATTFVAPVVIRWAVLASREKAAGMKLSVDDLMARFHWSTGLLLLLALVQVVSAIAALTVVITPFLVIPAIRIFSFGDVGNIVRVVVLIALQVVFSVGYFLWLFAPDRHTNKNRLGDVGFIATWITVSTTVFALLFGYVLTSHESLYSRMTWQIPEGGVFSIVGALFGAIVCGIAIGRRPRLLACAGFGLALGHLLAMIPMVVVVANSPPANTASAIWQESLPSTLYTIYCAGMMTGVLIAIGGYFALYQRVDDTEREGASGQ